MGSFGKVIAAAASALFGFTLAAAAQGAPDYKSVLEAARKEGSLVVRITSPGRPETHQALIQAFNKRFGLDLKIEWSPVSSVQTGTRVITEAAGGRGTVDLIGSGGAEEASLLVERNLLKPYPWEAVFGKELPKIAGLAESVMPDLKGKVLPIMDAVYGLAWNPSLVKEMDLPTKMLDLLDRRWKGKAVVNAQFLIPFEALAHGKDEGEAFTLDTAKKLLANEPILERGTPAVSRAVSVGQAPVGVSTYHAAKRAETSGEPQRFRLFSDYVPVYPLYIYIPETAPHPQAARLFAAWLVTEGAAITATFEAAPRISDPDDPLSGLVAAQKKDTGAVVLSPVSLSEIKTTEPMRKTITMMISGQAPR